VQIAIPPAAFAASSQAGASVALKAGDVVDALVLELVDAGKVRIALADTIMEVVSQVPLAPGTKVQLAVKGTGQELTLALVEGGEAPPVAPPASTGASPAATAVRASVAPRIADAAVVKTTAAIAEIAPATHLPAATRPALSQAVQTAAARQGSLAPLFADLTAAATTQALPQPVRQAMARVLALQTSTAAPVTAGDVKQAFARSGLFLEAQLGATTAAGGSPPPLPDLKAALLVLRQVLKTWSEASAPPQKGAPAATAAPQPALTPNAAPQPDGAVAKPPADARTTLDPALLRDLEMAVATDRADGQMPAALPSRETSARMLLSALEQSAASSRRRGANPIPEHTEAAPEANTAPAAPRPTTPPPPYRGAPPAAQPPATVSIEQMSQPHDVAEHLLTETDAALARQTLLQAASLPDGADRTQRDTQAPRWHFEIPLATPQGTAVAQFEIARDRRSTAPEQDVQPVWRARFTLEMEPIGPVHVQISLAGARTGVTLWAEREASAARLRQDAPLLAQALSAAELEPGDVLVRNGEPPRPREPGAGKFLDRAS
jgi:flagellar hook-length control protein FliK